MTDPDSRPFARKVSNSVIRTGSGSDRAQSSTKACDGFAEVSLKLNSGPVATAPGSDTDPD